MKRKACNITALLLAGALLISGVAGCSKKPADSSKQTTAAGEKTKLTGMIYLSGQTAPSDTFQWLQDAMDNAGVEIEWQEIRSTDWSELKGTMLGSGNIPDITIGSGAFEVSDFTTFKGLFKDLSPYLENAPNIQKMFNEHAEIKTLATNEDGTIYGIPKYQRWWPQSWYRQYINKTWLDNLGLDVPKTWDELYLVLKAFKEQDPNGNGKADEIPFSFCDNASIQVVNPYILMSNFGIVFDHFKSASGYYADDGEVKNFIGSDEYKQYVEYMHKLYQEGLIQSEGFTLKDAAWLGAARQGEEAGEATYGYFNAWVASDIVGAKLKDQYISIPPLKVNADQEKEALWTYEYEALNYKEVAAVVSEKCREPEAAVRFINELYDPERSIEILFGDMGENVKDNGDGTYTVLSPAEAGDTEGLDAGAWKWKTTMADMGPGCIDDQVEVALPEDLREVRADEKHQNELFSKMDMEANQLHHKFLKLSDADRVQITQIESNIISLATPQFVEWVVNGGVESGWDKFQQSLKSTGMEEGRQIYQKALNEYLNKK